MSRIYNFSAGPCTLPLPVLEEVQAEFVDYQGSGMSLIEMSHRGKYFPPVLESAKAGLRRVAGIPDTHEVLFVAGGATMQFTMLPMNLLSDGGLGQYSMTGAWAKKAIAEAARLGRVELSYDGKDNQYTCLPDPASVRAVDGASYYHLTSNETIGGIQWQDFPQLDIPLVADMSSDILSRPVPWERFGVVYAGAQKNIGPAGLGVVVIRKDVLEALPEIPGYMGYRGHAQAGSMLNTPPVFQIWMVERVLAWLESQGGLSYAQDLAVQRSSAVYAVIDQSQGFYDCPADPQVRSRMNPVFRLPSEELEDRFVKTAADEGMDGLRGHRSTGGIRASMYNAMPLEGAYALAQFMTSFAQKHG